MVNNDEMDRMKYYMAAEKVMSLLFHIEQTLEFFDEYQIKADEEVKRELLPKLEELKKWLHSPQ